MPRALEQLLAPQTIRAAISQVELAGASLQNLFGWSLTGANVARHSGRQFVYDVFDNSRAVATGRAPGQPASRQAPQRVGQVRGVFPRAAECVSLLDEDLLNRRRVGGPAGELDAGGESYLTRQELYLAQRFVNLREFQTAAMLRGAYSYTQDGDDLRHGFGGGEVAIAYQLPAGNQGQLDMLGDGPLLDADWADAACDIPRHLQAINAALVRLTGWGLAHVALSGAAWQMVLGNTRVQTLGGSADAPFQSLRRVGAGEFAAVLRAIPWVTFHVIDYGLFTWTGAAETFTKLLPDDHAAFFPEPSARWAQYLEGSEMVTEGPGGPRSEQFGFYPYAYATHDPSGWDLCAVHNGLPALLTPSAIAYGKITGGVYN